MIGPTSHHPRSVAGLVALATLLLFAATVCPTVPFGDGGELIAAASCLGVAHPPGYPLYTMLGWLALAVRWGEPALRMNLLSALFGSLTCAAVAWLVMRESGSVVGAVTGAMALAVSATFWSVATVAEVYTLHLFLVMTLLCAAAAAGEGADERTRKWALLIGASALGLGLAHHPTIVLSVPAALVLASSGGVKRVPDSSLAPARSAGSLSRFLPAVPMLWMVLAVFVAATVPLLLAWTLMIRARHHPASNWGRPENLQLLLSHVTAASYRHLDLGWTGLARAASWQRLRELAVGEFTVVAFPLAALGLVGLERWGGRAVSARIRIALALLIAASIIFGLRYATEDVEVFYLPAVVGIAIASGLGVARLRWATRPLLRVVATVLAVLLVALPAATHARARNLRRMTASADYGEDILGTLPEKAALFVETDEAFVLLYLQQVKGERRDVTIYDRTGTLFHDLAAELTVPARPEEPHREYRVRVEQEFIDRELARPNPRAIFFLGWPGYEVPPRYRLEPVGLLYRVCRSEVPMTEDAPIWARYHEATALEQALRTQESFALAVAATYPLARGERALFRGDRAHAFERFDEAERLASRTAGVHSYIGTLYGRIGEYGRAIQAFERSIEIKPVSVRAWNNLALAYRLSGDKEGAKRAWTRSLELIPSQDDVVASLRELGRDPR